VRLVVYQYKCIYVETETKPFTVTELETKIISKLKL